MNEQTNIAPAQVDPQVALATAVAEYTRRGWRAESYGPNQVTMVRGRRANHILHLLLSVLTLGLWLLVWLIVGLSSKEVRTVLAVDRWGRVQDAAALRQASVPPRLGTQADDWKLLRDPIGIGLLAALVVAFLWAVTGWAGAA